MKKLFIVLAVASLGFVACNNDSDSAETADTTKVDSPVVTPPVMSDTTTMMDTTKKDTTKM